MPFALTEVRDKLAAVLAPIEDSDPNICLSLVDAIEPPALMLGWGEPWLQPDSMCFSRARVQITCVAARLAPGEGQAMLEELVSYTLGRIRSDPSNWVFEAVSGPRVLPIAKTNYLAARITVLAYVD